MYRLFRDATKYMKGHHVKDLSKLNRDLKKVIYIDWDPNSFQLQPENALRLTKWDGSNDDTSLIDLAALLRGMHRFKKVLNKKSFIDEVQGLKDGVYPLHQF